MVFIKKVKFPTPILMVLSLLLVLVIIIGTYSYKKFTTVVEEVTQENGTNELLVNLKSLTNELARAENSVKTYGLTNDSTYVISFEKSIEQTDHILDNLKSISKKNQSLSKTDLAELQKLISKKYKILADYLLLQSENRVSEALKKLQSNMHGETTEKSSSSGDKKGIIKKLFHNNNQDYSSKKKVKIANVDAQIKKIKDEENAVIAELISEELKLIEEDKQITSYITDLLYGLEIEENERNIERANYVAENVDKVKWQITIFFILAGILVLFIAGLIVKYVSANNRFRKALRQAKRQAERLAETKEHFLNNMSHEIRTPMNAISGFVDLLAKKDIGAEENEHVKMIQKSTNHLLHIIDEVLVFTKLQNKKYEIANSAIQINGFINDLTQILRPLAEAKNIDLNTKVSELVPPILLGDAHKINQILINVVGNAIKFTQMGFVEISVSEGKNQGDLTEIYFTVKDTGIGMTEEQVEKIFDEFEQAEVSTTRDYGGTGLGLSITKMLVELMNGEIEVTSELNEGTEFTIKLPLTIGAKSDLESPKLYDSKLKLKNLNVLIVDDEEYNRKLLKAILRNHQLNFGEAKNGNEAIEKLKRGNYDIVLMDSRMPELNGIDASKKIRDMQDTRISKVPIIALSAAVTEDDQKIYRLAGMNGFLPKPFKEAELVNEINRVLGNAVIELQLQSVADSVDEAKLEFDQLRILSNGDEDFYKDMLQTFYDDAKKGVDEINSALAEENYHVVAEYAHKICAPCNHIGAVRMYNLLKDIEIECRKENPKSVIVESYVNELNAATKSALVQVQKEIEKVP